MTRILRLLLLTLSLLSVGVVHADWANTKGINFRATAIFVADGANESYDLGDSYPTSKTIDGDTFNIGWTTSQTGLARDRNSSVDQRLAGLNQRPNDGSVVTTWKIDLPSAGQYTIHLAMGDNDSAKANYWRILDDTTPLETFSNVATSAGQWADAAGTVRTSAADWVANNTARSYTFATTTLVIELSDPAQIAAGDTAISHISIAAATSTSGLLLRRRRN